MMEIHHTSLTFEELKEAVYNYMVKRKEIYNRTVQNRLNRHYYIDTIWARDNERSDDWGTEPKRGLIVEYTMDDSI